MSVAGDRLRLNAPAGVLTQELRAELSAQKPALLALLAQEEADDQVRADDGLAGVLALIDGAERKGVSQARRNVLQVYREVARDYHANRDHLLFEVVPTVEALLARWRRPPASPSPSRFVYRHDLSDGDDPFPDEGQRR
jgi:hypothetical protein